MAVALFFAQIGAMAHGYSHDARGSDAATHRSTPASHDFCGDCLSFAPLLAAAGAVSPLAFAVPLGAALAPLAVRRVEVDRPPRLAFRSRAPPATPYP